MSIDKYTESKEPFNGSDRQLLARLDERTSHLHDFAEGLSRRIGRIEMAVWLAVLSGASALLGIFFAGGLA